MNNYEEKEKVLNRLKTIKGHINGIEKMIEEEKDCKEILHQISAIQSSVNTVGKIVIKNYATKCIKDSINQEDDFEDILNMVFKYIT